MSASVWLFVNLWQEGAESQNAPLGFSLRVTRNNKRARFHDEIASGRRAMKMT
jgi:hypothetical protein